MSGPAGYLNGLSQPETRLALSRCCGSSSWVDRMSALRPYADDPSLYEAADRVWWQLDPEDWLEAFSHHARIGDEGLEGWSGDEQSGMVDAAAEVRRALAVGNAEYETRFGHLFLICATGLTPGAMLAALRERLERDAETELRTAAGEQSKITRLRLARLGSD